MLQPLVTLCCFCSVIATPGAVCTGFKPRGVPQRQLTGNVFKAAKPMNEGRPRMLRSTDVDRSRRRNGALLVQ
ncbi:hypothetical protein CSUI_005164 [Cystoisospora suis]|uniref:Secreted protein n=1 Tax=Cystoisospora suis TaxID=483139 RepID=A0A2C6KUP1_9APIC|nr:hypothetical protein CSUI_005164 [Cystoisospora suis]